MALLIGRSLKRPNSRFVPSTHQNRFPPQGNVTCFKKFSQLASLVPREEYLHRAPHDAAEGLRLYTVNHA